MDPQVLKNIQDWRTVWADNTDLDNVERGIISFSRRILGTEVKEEYGVAQTHKDSYHEFLSLYSSQFKYDTERRLQIKEPRGFAKSTRFLFVIPLYLIAFNGSRIKLPGGEEVFLKEDFIALCSETNLFATNWVMKLRAELVTNDLLRTYFGSMKPVSIKDETGLWRRDTFITNKKTLPSPYKGANLVVAGRGVGQQIRGMNIKGRPTLIVFDDIYSKNNIITPETRAKVKNWFNNEAINTLDNNMGKAVLVGTMIHEDTVFTDNENATSWKCLEKPVMEENKFNEVLSLYCRIDRDKRTVEIPNSGECDELERAGYTTYWKEKFPLEYMLQKFRDSIERSNESGLWQEYFHKVLAEADKQIKPTMFRRRDFSIITAEVGGRRVPFVKEYLEGIVHPIYKNLNLVVAIDTAISRSEVSDDTAICLVGMTSRREIYVIRMRSGKFGIRDNIKPEYLNEYRDRRQLVQDTSVLEQIGSVDETFRMIKHLEPWIIVETQSEGTNFARAFRIAKKDFGKPHLRVMEFVAKTNKVERILDALLPYYETHVVYHPFGLTKLEHQLEYLKKVAHDDEADALATAVTYLKPPPDVPFPLQKKTVKPDNLRETMKRSKRRVVSTDDWQLGVLIS